MTHGVRFCRTREVYGPTRPEPYRATQDYAIVTYRAVFDGTEDDDGWLECDILVTVDPPGTVTDGSVGRRNVISFCSVSPQQVQAAEHLQESEVAREAPELIAMLTPQRLAGGVMRYPG